MRESTNDPSSAQDGDVRLVNLCPHDVVIHGRDGTTLTVPPEPVAARCVVERVEVGTLVVDGCSLTMVESQVVEPPTLPESTVGVLFIVSRMVAEAMPDRRDLVFPDGLVRDDEGAVVGCAALARLA